MSSEDHTPHLFPSDDEVQKIVAQYKRALKEDKPLRFSALDFNHIVNYYRRANRTDAALFAVGLALKRFPNDFSLQMSEVNVLIVHGDYHLVMDKLGKLIARYPNETELLWKLATTHLRLNEAPKSKAVFEEILARETAQNRKAACAYIIGSHFLSFIEFDFALHYFLLANTWGHNDKRIYAAIAACYENLADYRKAIEYYVLHLKFNPYAVEHWDSLGHCYLALADNANAIEAFEFARAIDPEFLPSLLGMGKAYLMEKVYDEALEAFVSAEPLSPDSEALQCFIADCYMHKKLHHKAKNHYTQAINMNENYAPAFHGLSMLHFLFQELEDALYYVRRAIALAPETAAFWLTYGDLQCEFGIVDKAISAYEKAIETEHGLEEAWLNLSDIFFNAGQIEVATGLMQKAYKHNHDKAKTNFRLAAYLLSTNHNQQGIQHLETGLQIEKEQLNEFIHWFPAYLVNDDVKQVLRHYSVNF